ncbi:unnamed protein product, partial [Didymodactylos carnosus]
TPKRPASDDGSLMIQNTPRRKLIKTNQKENGSQQLNDETEITGVESDEIESIADKTDEDHDEDSNEIPPSQKGSNKMMTRADEHDLEMKVDECSRDTQAINMNGDNEEEEQKMDIDIPTVEKISSSSQNSTKRRSSRHTKVLFSSTNDSHQPKVLSSEVSQQTPQRLRRTRSASTNTSSTINDNQSSNSTRRRKSCSASNIRTFDVIVKKTFSLSTNSSRMQSSTRKSNNDTPLRQKNEKVRNNIS